MKALPSMRTETVATLIFAVAGMVGTVASGHQWSARLPTALFYGALIFLVLVVIAFFLWLRAVKK